MMFPNAYEGFRRIFLAEVLTLIGIACSFIGTATGSYFIYMMSSVMAIVSLVFILIGLNQAAKDQSSFRVAFILTFINLLLSIVLGVLSEFGLPVLSPVSTIVSNGMSIAVDIMVFRGIKILAKKLYREDITKFGNIVLAILIIVNAITILVTLISFFEFSVKIAAFLITLSFVTGILGIVAYVFYLIYLNRVKNMLA